MKSKARFETIDEYLAGVKDDQRAALQKLRRAIRAAAPRAEESISYGIPAFRLDGKLLVCFGAAARHCAFYPGTAQQAFRKELRGFDTSSKGTVRFQPDHLLPAALVRRIVKARMARIGAGKGAAPRRRPREGAR